MWGKKIKAFVCKEPVDMRSSYDSLYRKTKELLDKDPYSGHIFVFINKRRNSCKCLFYDGTGFIIVAKRLDKGQFTKFNPRYRRELIFTQSEFGLFIEGAAMNKRFIESPAPRR